MGWLTHKCNGLRTGIFMYRYCMSSDLTQFLNNIMILKNLAKTWKLWELPLLVQIKCTRSWTRECLWTSKMFNGRGQWRYRWMTFCDDTKDTFVSHRGCQRVFDCVHFSSFASWCNLMPSLPAAGCHPDTTPLALFQPLCYRCGMMIIDISDTILRSRVPYCAILGSICQLNLSLSLTSYQIKSDCRELHRKSPTDIKKIIWGI